MSTNLVLEISSPTELDGARPLPPVIIGDQLSTLVILDLCVEDGVKHVVQRSNLGLLEERQLSAAMQERPKDFIRYPLSMIFATEFVDVHDLRFAGLTSLSGGGVSLGADFAGELDSGVDDGGAANGEGIDNFREARAKFEKEYLLRKISENKGNISKTAEAIGLERSYLHRKIKGYGIDVEEIV